MDTLLYVQREGRCAEPAGSHAAGGRRAQRFTGAPAVITAVVVVLAVLIASALPVFAAPVTRTASPTTPTSSVEPLSASGCNQSVCIYVTGSGTDVTNWSTSATLPGSMCTVADYWADQNLVYQGNEKCGSGGTSVSSYWPQPGYFPAGTQLCNTWSNISGRPCESVE